jgi:hypothetical protein
MILRVRHRAAGREQSRRRQCIHLEKRTFIMKAVYSFGNLAASESSENTEGPSE